MIQDKWYEHFFQGIAGEFWEHLAEGEYTEAEGEFVSRLLNLPTGSKILDAPSGGGRISLWLGEYKKMRMYGIDINPESVSKFNHEAARKGLDARAQVMDLSKAEKEIGRYEGALCLGNCFGYFNERGMESFIRRISNSLSKNGVWIIQSGMLAESIFPNWQDEDFFEVNGITMSIQNAYDPYESKIFIEATFAMPDGKTQSKTFQHFIYTLKEVRKMLEREGLEIVEMYGGIDGREFALGDEQIYIVARKD